MSEKFFVVSKYPNADEPTDIGFTPVHDGPIPKEYSKFKSDVELFVSTIKILFSDNEVARLDFLERAFLASELCFSGNKADITTACSDLQSVKDELTLNYWSRVRNKILLNYLAASVVFSITFFICFIFFNESKFFFVSMLGVCIGSWLSLAIRTKEISFDDIRQHISEASSPFIRCIFITLLSSVFVILFDVGVVEIKIGRISSLEISNNFNIAFVIGVFLGFGEKYLITTIRQKSKDVLG